MTSLIMQVHDVHECLKIICEIESDILNTSILSIFKKKNYEQHEQTLNIVCDKLMDLNTEINRNLGKQRGVDRFIECNKEYISALLQSTYQLINLNNRLSKKAKNGNYTLKEYNNDLKYFDFLQRRYCEIGNNMNTYYNLYLHEIIEIE
jgi:hypothetical protein